MPVVERRLPCAEARTRCGRRAVIYAVRVPIIDNPPLRFPKDQIKVLLLENIHADAEAAIRAEGYQLETVAASLAPDELKEKIADVHLLGIRSGTLVTADVLDAAPKLLAVGAFCIGTNQIDLTAAAGHGVAAFNAPFSNTRSVVEMAIGEIISLYRGLGDKNMQMHQGDWNKSATGSHEIRGRRLGIVGYGNIGSQLSVLAESLGMQVYYHDLEERLPLGNAHKCASLEELLSSVDIVSLHVDGRPENQGLFGAEQFEQMRDQALFLNLSRGFVIDPDALAAAIGNGKLLGAAVDVFPTEPKSKGQSFESPLRGLPNVILTPHVGGSTMEAQADIGGFVADKLISFVNSGSTSLSVNLPQLSLPEQAHTHRFIHIHVNEPGVLAKLNNVLSAHDVNISGQYLGTNETVGYVVIDINAADAAPAADVTRQIEEQLRALPETIRVRTLY